MSESEIATWFGLQTGADSHAVTTDSIMVRLRADIKKSNGVNNQGPLLDDLSFLR